MKEFAIAVVSLLVGAAIGSAGIYFTIAVGQESTEQNERIEKLTAENKTLNEGIAQSSRENGKLIREKKRLQDELNAKKCALAQFLLSFRDQVARTRAAAEQYEGATIALKKYPASKDHQDAQAKALREFRAGARNLVKMATAGKKLISEVAKNINGDVTSIGVAEVGSNVNGMLNALAGIEDNLQNWEFLFQLLENLVRGDYDAVIAAGTEGEPMK